MSDSEREKGAFQVKDKRRFDADGNERNEEGGPTVAPAASQASAPKKEGEQTDAKASGGEFTMENKAGQTGDEIDFSAFIMSLTTQALMQLGEMAPPDGVEIPVDVQGARQTIEIIAMLQKRTTGNLSAVEAKLIEDILHNLRMSYLRHA